MNKCCSSVHLKVVEMLNKVSDLPPFFFRLILAYGFYEPAMNKWKDIKAVGDWFAGLGYPMPHFQAYMAASTEITGVVLLLLGLCTRLISIPLMVIMVVAVTTVHLKNGFPCGKNGFEIPFYYFFMLYSLLISGPGRISLDALICKRCKNKE